jgi:undecaprenyl-diphosphatase
MTPPEPWLLDRLVECDRSVLLWVASTLRSAPLDRLMLAVTDPWSFAIPATLLALFLAGPGGRRGRVVLALAVVAALLGDFAGAQLKELFARPRPCTALAGTLEPLLDCGAAFSLPSNHATNSFAVVTVIGLFYRRLALPAAALALLVAYSRLHLGVHYPSDVLAGAVLGTAVGGALGGAAKRWLERSPPCTSA